MPVLGAGGEDNDLKIVKIGECLESRIDPD
jgi:hypothetical protein